MVNEVLQSARFEEVRRWRWKHGGHINVLGSSSVQSLLTQVAMQGGNLRLPCVVDSRVTLFSQSKGRSSSSAMKTGLEKTAAVSIAGGICTSMLFGPTRHNVSDDPT